MKYSIIIPIYNVEMFLAQTIESVLKQLNIDSEIILVNDGSPDNCKDICDGYSLIDSRVKVIHKENGGLSDARNVGLEIASNEYILFLDGDDTLCENALSNIDAFISNNREVDFLLMSYNRINGDQIDFCDLKFVESTDFIIKRVSDLIRANGCIWSSWRSVYRRSFLLDNELRFDTGYVGAEDCHFFFKLICKSPNMRCFNVPLVNYVMNRVGSITETQSRKKHINTNFDLVDCQLSVFLYWFDYFRKSDIFLTKYMANKYVSLFPLILRSSSEIVDYAQGCLDNNKLLLEHTNGFKYYIASVVLKNLSLKQLSYMYRKINQYY